jgi:hypothetical protein
MYRTQHNFITVWTPGASVRGALDGWTSGGRVRVLGLANSESKFILYETYKSGPTCHILAGSPSGSGYGATENIPTPTVPDGHNK